MAVQLSGTDLHQLLGWRLGTPSAEAIQGVPLQLAFVRGEIEEERAQPWLSAVAQEQGVRKVNLLVAGRSGEGLPQYVRCRRIVAVGERLVEPPDYELETATALWIQKDRNDVGLQGSSPLLGQDFRCGSADVPRRIGKLLTHLVGTAGQVQAESRFQGCCRNLSALAQRLENRRSALRHQCPCR